MGRKYGFRAWKIHLQSCTTGRSLESFRSLVKIRDDWGFTNEPLHRIDFYEGDHDRARQAGTALGRTGHMHGWQAIPFSFAAFEAVAG
jgi:hypothetical protein